MSGDDEFVARRIEEIKHMDNWSTSYCQYPEMDWGGHEELVEPLTELLFEYDGETARARAAKALAYTGDDRALDRLRDVVREDPSAEVRNAAVWGLRSLNDPDAVPTLRTVANGDPDEDVRWQAGRALGRVEWTGKPEYAVELLRGGEDRVWEGFVGEIGRDYVEDGQAVFERLRNALGDEDADTARVIEGLGQFGDAGDVLLDAVDHDDPAVREGAIDGLRRQQPTGTVERLREAAERDPATSVRAAAVEALGYVLNDDAGRETLPALRPFVGDEAAAVRAGAVWQLRRADRPANVPALLEALDDPDPDVRAKAAWGLKVTGHPSAVPELLDASGDDDPDVRHNVFRALCWIAGDLGQTDATGFHLLDSETVRAIGDRGPRAHSPERALSVLREGLADPEEGVRREAVRTLAETGHPDAAALLAEVVREWELTSLRRRAIYYLGRFQDDRARDAHRYALDADDPSVRAKAVSEVRSLPDGEVSPALLDALEDESPEVRREAAGQVKWIDDPAVEDAVRPLLDDEDEEVRYAAKDALDAFDER